MCMWTFIMDLMNIFPARGAGWFFFVEPSEDRHLSISPSWLLSIFCQGIIIHIAIPSCNTLPGLPHLTSIGVVGLLGWTQIFIIIFIISFS